MDVPLFSYVNHVMAAPTVIAAASQAGDLTPENAAHPLPRRRWRTNTLTDWWQGDFAGNVPVGVVALLFPRDTLFPLAGTVRHRFDADGGTPGTGALHDSGALPIGTVAGYGYHAYVLASAINARYWRATFAVSGIPFLDLGIGWAGAAFRPSRNYVFGHGEAWNDLSRVTQSERSGAEFVDPRPRQRSLSFSIPFAAADLTEAREMQRIAGLEKQVLYIRDPTGTLGTETIIGRFAETLPILHQAAPIYAKAFVIRESV